MKNISFRISDEEREKLETYARENDLSLSQVIRKAIKGFLEKIQIAE